MLDGKRDGGGASPKRGGRASESGGRGGMAKWTGGWWSYVMRNMHVSKHTESVLLSFVTYLSIGFMVAIVTVLYEYRNLANARMSGFGNGPICGRRAGAKPMPQVWEKSGADMEELKLPQFIKEYIHAYQPAVFRGGLVSTDLERLQKHMTDEDMVHFYNKHMDKEVEYEMNKVEKRSTGLQTTNIENFIGKYREKGWYVVHNMMWPDIQDSEMFSNFPIPKLVADVLINRDGASPDIEHPFPQIIMWLSYGGTKSVVHLDDFINFHFCIEGTKTFYVADPSFVDDLYFPSFIYEGGTALEDYDQRRSPVKFYNPDFKTYPRFKDVKWTRIDIKPGDMLFLPRYMVHYVETPENQRSISINLFIEDDLNNDDVYGFQSGCQGIINMLSFMPRALMQIVKDIYFMRPAYILNQITGLPDWLIPYSCYSSLVDLYCRNGMPQAWNNLESEIANAFKEPYVGMREVFDDFLEFRCIQSVENKRLAYVGLAMMLGGIVTYAYREASNYTRGSSLVRSKALMA